MEGISRRKEIWAVSLFHSGGRGPPKDHQWLDPVRRKKERSRLGRSPTKSPMSTFSRSDVIDVLCKCIVVLSKNPLAGRQHVCSLGLQTEGGKEGEMLGNPVSAHLFRPSFSPSENDSLYSEAASAAELTFCFLSSSLFSNLFCLHSLPALSACLPRKPSLEHDAR